MIALYVVFIVILLIIRPVHALVSAGILTVIYVAVLLSAQMCERHRYMRLHPDTDREDYRSYKRKGGL